MAQAELLWALLDGHHPVEDLKEVDVAGVNWSSRSLDGKTLMVSFIHKVLCQPKSKFDAGLKTIEWLVHSGASIEQKCTGGETEMFFTKDQENTTVKLECKGRSAISYVKGWQQKLRGLPCWQAEFDFLPRILICFARASNRMSNRPRVSIDEGIAELWEKSLAAKDSHDLTIETADGVVTAHAHMLKAASSVVTAMLESPMKEGKAHRIEIKDTSSKAASVFLEILYTCSAQDEPDHEIALHALDLAHRWQVEAVVEILTDLLAGMITDESFAGIAEHAILKGIERLKAPARRFGAESAKVQADLKASRLPAAVAQLFHGGSKPSKPSEQKPKRRRM